MQTAVVGSAVNTYAHASEHHFREVAVDRLPVEAHDEDRILRPIGPAVDLDMRSAPAMRGTPLALSKACRRSHSLIIKYLEPEHARGGGRRYGVPGLRGRGASKRQICIPSIDTAFAVVTTIRVGE